MVPFLMIITLFDTIEPLATSQIVYGMVYGAWCIWYSYHIWYDFYCSATLLVHGTAYIQNDVYGSHHSHFFTNYKHQGYATITRLHQSMWFASQNGRRIVVPCPDVAPIDRG